jgi:hypothetical protein
VIHGTPSRFKDPARFSFAHGGKDGHPFPVPTKVYDETIGVLQNAIHKAKLGNGEKNEAIKRLTQIAQRAEQDFIPNANFDKVIEKKEIIHGNMAGALYLVKPAAWSVIIFEAKLIRCELFDRLPASLDAFISAWLASSPCCIKVTLPSSISRL